MFWKMAWQFLRRGFSRNLLVMGAIAISVFVLVFLSGLMAGIRDEFLSRTVQEGGHLRIHAQGWSARSEVLSLSPVLPDPQGDLMRIRNLSGVVDAEEVLPFGGVLQVGERTWYTEVDGVDPKGFSVASSREALRWGSFSLAGNSIVIGSEAAKLLKLKVGDPVVLLCQDVDDMPFYREFRVGGIYDAASESGAGERAFVSLGQARDATGLGTSGLEIRVRLRTADLADQVRPALITALSSEDIEVKTWEEFQGSLLVFLQVFNVFVAGMDIFLIVVAAAVIANSLLMNFLDRLPVLATLRAVGMRRSGALGLVLREACLQGGFGTLVGLVVGTIVVGILSVHGLDFGQAGRALGLGQKFPFRLDPILLAQSAAVGMVTVLAASFYAGRVGSRMPILEGLGEV